MFDRGGRYLLCQSQAIPCAMNTDHDKLIHLQLVLLSLIESPHVADPTRELVEKASREHEVIHLLRDRCSSHPIFRSFDGVLGFDSLEDCLGSAIQAFLPRAARYGLHNSGLCLIAAAISHASFGAVVKPEASAQPGSARR